MSVLIKGMDMPKRGDSLIFDTINKKLRCRNLDILDDDWYEVVEIPMPHGRLIDADKITMHKQLEACGNGKYKSVLVAYENNIDVAPTVIESEE